MTAPTQPSSPAREPGEASLPVVAKPDVSFPPLPQGAILSDGAWSWSIERDAIWRGRVIHAQAQVDALTRERDEAREGETFWRDEYNKLVVHHADEEEKRDALKSAQPLADLEALMGLALEMCAAAARENFIPGGFYRAREALRAALTAALNQKESHDH